MLYFAYAVVPAFWPPVHRGAVASGAAVEVSCVATHTRAFAILSTFPVGWKVALVASREPFEGDDDRWLAACELAAAPDECWIQTEN